MQYSCRAILSITIPYSFRENDDGESRRRLWNDFLNRDDLPHQLYCKEVDLEEGYGLIVEVWHYLQVQWFLQTTNLFEQSFASGKSALVVQYF